MEFNKTKLEEIRKKFNITDSTVFEVNHEGWASIYSGLGSVWESTAQDYDFSFREYDTANDLDGISFTGLSNEEICEIFEAFEFREAA